MTIDDVRALLRKKCDRAGGQAAWATLHSISAPYVGDVLNSRREPGEKILNALGIERVTTYKRVRLGLKADRARGRR